jgi:hypothetical protein
MTTQAQIEAALNAVKFCLIKGTEPFRVDLEILCDALTAAAQVGETEHDMPPIHIVVEHTIKAATIERCAQVADNFIDPRDAFANLPGKIAAAIRKLRDETHTAAQ